jgi:glycosyltransferase involved in cell wall biosynthesis
MVSIVIPTFNRAKFLRECVDSALAQDYPYFEVIVVDDGSTDDTLLVCREYGQRIRYFWKPNGGAASAENFGVRNMRGEWLKILGSDDILEKNALSTFLEWATREKACLLHCDFVDIDPHGNLLGGLQSRRQLKGDAFLRWLWAGRHSKRDPLLLGAFTGIGFAHRSVILEVGLAEESLRVGEDWEWALRAALIHRLTGVFVPVPLCRLRTHSGQLMALSGMRETARGSRIRNVFKHSLSREAESAPAIMEHYRQDALRLRRIFLPIVLASGYLRRIPFHRSVKFWAWEKAPRLMDRIYWAVNPPVDV